MFSVSLDRRACTSLIPQEQGQKISTRHRSATQREVSLKYDFIHCCPPSPVQNRHYCLPCMRARYATRITTTCTRHRCMPTQVCLVIPTFRSFSFVLHNQKIQRKPPYTLQSSSSQIHSLICNLDCTTNTSPHNHSSQPSTSNISPSKIPSCHGTNLDPEALDMTRPRKFVYSLTIRHIIFSNGFPISTDCILQDISTTAPHSTTTASRKAAREGVACGNTHTRTLDQD